MHPDFTAQAGKTQCPSGAPRNVVMQATISIRDGGSVPFLASSSFLRLECEHDG